MRLWDGLDQSALKKDSHRSAAPRPAQDVHEGCSRRGAGAGTRTRGLEEQQALRLVFWVWGWGCLHYTVQNPDLLKLLSLEEMRVYKFIFSLPF